MKLGKNTTAVIRNVILNDPTMKALITAYVEDRIEGNEFDIQLEINIEPITPKEEG